MYSFHRSYAPLAAALWPGRTQYVATMQRCCSWVQEMARGSRPLEAENGAASGIAGLDGTDNGAGEGGKAPTLQPAAAAEAETAAVAEGIALNCVGDEWSTGAELRAVIDDFIMVRRVCTVLETRHRMLRPLARGTTLGSSHSHKALNSRTQTGRGRTERLECTTSSNR